MLFCLLLSSAVLVVMLQDTPHCNSASRHATIESLSHRGTFCIDGSAFDEQTVDKVLIDGKCFSTKPPMLPVLMCGPYILFSEITGISYENNQSLSIAFVNFMGGVLPYLLLLYFFYRFLLLWTASDRTVILALLVFTFNFIGLGYATDLNNHTAAAACLFISFYFAYRIKLDGVGKISDWIISGLLGGLSATLEFWGGFFVISIFAYLALVNRKRLLLLFLPMAALPVAVHFLLTWVASGSLLPVYLRPELYQYQGSYWTEPTGIDALHEPKHIYFFHIIFGHHGFIAMTPVFFLGIYSMIKNILSRSEKYSEAITIGVPLLATVLFLGIRTRNYGGVCAGLRWMIVGMPFLFAFVASWINEHTSKKAMILLILLTAVGLAVLTDVPWSHAGPWHHSGWHKYLFGLY